MNQLLGNGRVRTVLSSRSTRPQTRVPGLGLRLGRCRLLFDSVNIFDIGMRYRLSMQQLTLFRFGIHFALGLKRMEESD
jgi:hypothetical protein